MSRLYPWPSFLNIFINDLSLFIEINAICNSAVDNTMYFTDRNVNIVIKRLRHNFAIISDWFYENYYMVLNPGKCYFQTLAFNYPLPYFPFNNITSENLTEEKVINYKR